MHGKGDRIDLAASFMKSPSDQPRYRAEVDGLRALAVVPVMLFHAGFDWIRGGYLGVDVFFVISGYLITTIIAVDLECRRFSIVQFYERRARRILPALFLVLLVCTPIALLVMVPAQVRSYSQSVVAVSVFASNVYFWRTSDYFDLASEEAPLLHTWSLGVEEQFYVIFPLFMVAFWRFGRRALVALCFCVALSSLALSEFFWREHAVANFFLAPTRAWELLLGSMLALVCVERPMETRVSRRIGGFLAIVGLVSIVFSMIAFSPETPMPSLYGLVPTVGTVLVLAFSSSDNWAGRLLSLRPFVWIGLISYSAYLWHQPVLAISRVVGVPDQSHGIMVVLLAVVLVLAAVTWKYVEQPCRNKKIWSRNDVFRLAAIGTVAFISFGVAGHLTTGFERTFEKRLTDSQVRRFQEVKNAIDTGAYNAMYDDGRCRFWTRRVTEEFRVRFEACASQMGRAVLVVGDSHALDTYNAFARVARHQFVVAVAKAGCRPTDRRRNCHYNGVDEFVADYAGSISHIFYTQSGRYLLRENNSEPVDYEQVYMVRSYLERLSRHAPVYWLGPQGELRRDMRLLNVLRDEGTGRESPLLHRLDAALQDAQWPARLKYISKIDLVAYDPSRDFFVSGRYTFSDKDHWSTWGETVFGSRLLKHAVVRDALGW